MMMPSRGDGLEHGQGHVAGSGRHIHKQIVAVPQNIRPELLDHAGNDGTAPDHGVGLILQQEVDGHDLDTGLGFRRDQGVFRAHGPVMDAESLGDGGAGDIGVQNTDLIAPAAHGNSQLAGDHGLAYAALTGYDTIDLAHMGVGMVGLQQGLRLPGSTALPTTGAVVRTFTHKLESPFSISNLTINNSMTGMIGTILYPFRSVRQHLDHK